MYNRPQTAEVTISAMAKMSQGKRLLCNEASMPTIDAEAADYFGA
jgi:hypothetical protein